MVAERIELTSQAEEKKRPPYADPRTHQFLLEAIAEGAHESLPARQRNIVGIYFGTDLTLEDIGRLLALKAKNKRERPRQIIESFIRHLRRNCSEELQQKYKLSEIKIGKPDSLAVSERKSTALGGKRREIRELISSGVTKRSETAKLLNVSREYVSNVFTSLRKKGLAPETGETKNKRLLEQARSAATDQEIREVFAQRPTLSLASKNSEVFVPIGKVARQLGFRFNPRDLSYFIEVLERVKIPFIKFERSVKSGQHKGEILIYSFILTKQIVEVAGLFTNSRELERFKELKSAKQVAGPQVELPSTWRILKRTDYIAVGNQLRRLGKRRPDFLVSCPVPVFKKGKKRRGVYLVASEDYSVFAADLEEFRQSLQV